MLSYITKIFNFLFTRNDEDDDDKENFLAEELLDLEVGQQTQSYNDMQVIKDLPRNTDCFKRTGVITFIDENIILIDGLFYYDALSCSIDVRLNDKVLYLGYKNSNDSVVIARILENQGSHWGDQSYEENMEENKYKIIEQVIVGEVEYRKDRFVYMKDKSLKFCLDEVEATFVPVKGDWLELNCKVQWDEEKPSDISAAQVLRVISMRPLRRRMKTATITEWFGEYGTCDRIIYFNKQSLQDGSEPCIGSKVMLEAIESNQGPCMWRAIKLCIVKSSESKNITPIKTLTQDATSLPIEKENNIDITYPLQFDAINIDETTTLDLNITNNSEQIHIINKWIVLSKRKDSQIIISPVLLRPRKLYPKQKVSFLITCKPKFFGYSREHLIIMFKGFEVNRIVEINIVNNYVVNNSICENRLSEYDKINNMRKIRIRNNSFIPGVRPIKPPAFVPVKLGRFPIPDKIWSTVLGDSEQTVYCSEYEKIVYKIASNFPCLLKGLNINNYIERWHTLLYMEEIQNDINMRAFDMPKVFLIRCSEYLAVEINGLSERRPSIIKGDRGIVKDIWNNMVQQYEGFVHVIKGNLVLMKFHQSFYESYSGCDVSIEFYSSRSSIRRSHQAVNLAISNLGVDVLFPFRILCQPRQVPAEKIESIKWYNINLNVEQKAAISNILHGECRPMPYCIYGPPGTGKTMTVIETILQILTLCPDSRLLIATPSNSAANLITERLIKYIHIFPNSMVRLIANYLIESDGIPDVIKPFCATLDIGSEHSKESRHIVKDEINLNCQKSFVGRQRITIGTCSCLGSLAQMGFPRGHFTHIIVDEAGQAIEPEILIPMNFIDKESGQIILAGDPMQLGPVIMSRYCKEFGMDESYFARVIQTFPYQRDYDAYDNGFNNKLITRLKDNYRSLQEVLTLPSSMFYDASLVAKLDRTQTWIQTIINIVSEIFESSNSNTGGVYVYGIRGCNARAEDSPSWYNPQEASMVALTTCKLYKKNVSENDIGIITPYIAQVKYIRLLFEAMGLPMPKIGSVEEFQGQERPIIIISTVRTTETHLSEDQKNILGFVKNPKRMNVALTRAQVVVLVFCDPHLLCTDPLWKKVIDYAITEDKYIGCDLPNDI